MSFFFYGGGKKCELRFQFLRSRFVIADGRSSRRNIKTYSSGSTSGSGSSSTLDELSYYRSLRGSRREVEDEGEVEGGKRNVRVADTIVWSGVVVLGDDGCCASMPIIIPQLEVSSKITKATKQVTNTISLTSPMRANIAYLQITTGTCVFHCITTRFFNLRSWKDSASLF